MGVGGVENLQSPGLLAPRQAAFARRKIVRRSREKSSINPPRAAPAARLDPADGAPNVAAMLNTRMRMLAAGVALAGGCLAFGAKLVLVHACGSDVPYMDQWDAVGNALLAPRAQGELRAADFLRPHNEHRPVFTRLIDYALAVSNRQWDPLLEMTVNAAIHACLCAALLLFARRLVTGLRYACAALVITLLFVLPFDWENTLQGFQSQFYLLEWGALGTLPGWACRRPRGPPVGGGEGGAAPRAWARCRRDSWPPPPPSSCWPRGQPSSAACPLGRRAPPPSWRPSARSASSRRAMCPAMTSSGPAPPGRGGAPRPPPCHGRSAGGRSRSSSCSCRSPSRRPR